MYTPARFIAIDNEKSHLDAIVASLQSLGVACLGIHYDGSALEKKFFGGVRVLLLDLHLLSGAKASDDKAHFGAIAALLEEYIDEDGGPFIVVLWTQHPQQAPELIAFLEERLEVAHARPLTVIPLDKTPYLKLESGEVSDPKKLREALTEQILRNPQINAVLSWETEVHRAAANTLASLIRLVPQDQRTAAAFPGALDTVLSRLAVASVGQNHVATDIRGAINGVLAPVLSDRLHAISGDETAELWKAAVTRHAEQLPELSHAAAGDLNRMLHMESFGVRPDAWGAVLDYPTGWVASARTEELFGTAYNDILRSEFKIKDDEIAACVPVLVRIGAVCDYAQKRAGPIPYAFGIERPVGKLSGLPGSVWVSPRLSSGKDPFLLLASARYVITFPSAAVEALVPRYRIREQLLMELIAKVSAYVARPGIISV